MSERAVKLTARIAGILEKLNSGTTVNVKDLAESFSVSERTIQKDLNDRIDPSIIENLGNGDYRMLPGYLGNITKEDIKEFSRISGIIDLYPDLDDVLKDKLKNSLIVNSSINRGCVPAAVDFKEVNFVINNNIKLRFDYNDKKYNVDPYKLLNSKGIWYLMALDGETVKSFCLHKMSRVRRDIHQFEKDSDLLDKIENNPSPWFKDSKTTVELKVEPSFVSYFKDRNIIDGILTEKIGRDGSLIITIEVNSLEEIKGTIKFWLPQIDVIEPSYLKEQIKEDIKKFL